MHAKPSLTVVSRFLLAIFSLSILFVMPGCKTEQPADAPTLIGTPPGDAYLGVEYYYNFGSYGGENILDYSLSNAPSWLALEDTSNKARPGIIMRGVPGLSGGNRGFSDLGTNQDVTLLGTDGKHVGLSPFDIEVHENIVSMEADPYTEGTPAEEPGDTRKTACDPPALEGKGSHTYQAQTYNDDGTILNPAETRTKETVPVLVKVLLDKPSVTTVKVAFELNSEFDPEKCDDNQAPPHQLCTHSQKNREQAIIGQDVVGLGSDSVATLPVPDYLTYQADESGFLTKGVLTLKPGTTECYIRLEVVSDDVAEQTESFRINLTSVREGIASLGAGNTGIAQSLSINDNETEVSFETPEGAVRDVINAKEKRLYTAHLIGRQEAETTYQVRLARGTGSTARLDEDYIIEMHNPDADADPPGPAWVKTDELSFPKGVDDVEFRISALNNNVAPLDNDKVIIVAVDQRYEDGRPYYAAPANNGLRVTINELVSELELGRADEFVPTDMLVGLNGQVVVTGVATGTAGGYQPGDVVLMVYDRKGALQQSQVVGDAAGTLDSPPRVRYSERSVKEGKLTIVRHELALVYGTRGNLSTATNAGGLDAVQTLLRFDPVQALYLPVWSVQTGTAGNDRPLSVALDRTGNLLVGGETDGVWPDNIQAGGVDSYVQRIDTTVKDNTESPSVAWTRQVGSGLDEHVTAIESQNNAGLLIGSSSGSVNGEPQIGGVDYFYYNAFSADSGITVHQLGTSRNDELGAGLLSGTDIWLALGPGGYQRKNRKNDDGTVTASLNSVNLNSPAGSVIRYRSPAILDAALTLNDIDDTATDTFSSLVVFDSDIIAGGSTDGQFESGASVGVGTAPILARLRPTSGEDEVPEEAGDVKLAPGVETQWRTQPTFDGAAVETLAEYRDDKILGLIRQSSVGGDVWNLVLFSGSGRQLNPYTP